VTNVTFDWGEFVTIYSHMVSELGDFEGGIHASETGVMTTTLLLSVIERNKKYKSCRNNQKDTTV
jgi:hypothetical protein